MKKLLFIIFMLLMFVPTVSAAEFEEKYKGIIERAEKNPFVLVTLKPYYFMPFDAEGELQPVVGVELCLTHKSGAYSYLSYEVDEFRLAGQGGLAIELISLGLGYKHKFDKHFSVFLDAGWYQPVFDDGWMEFYSSPFAEGMWHKMNHAIWPREFEYYKYELKGGVGGKAGVEFKKHIRKRVSFVASASVRFLKLQQTFMSTDEDIGFDPAQWVLHDSKDYGGFLLSLGLTF